MPKRLLSSVKIFYPDYSPTQLVGIIQKRLPALEKALSLKRVVLFGSWAVGRETAFSDIDLMVIYNGPPREEAYKLVRHFLKLRGLEPHVYTEEQAEKLKATLDRMTRQGIILFPKPSPIDRLGLPNKNMRKTR